MNIVFSPFFYFIVAILLFWLFHNRGSKIFFINIFFLNLILEILRLRGFIIKTENREFYIEDGITIFSCIVNSYFLLKLNFFSSRLIKFSLFFILSFFVGILLEFIFPYENRILNPSIGGAWEGYFSGDNSKEFVDINPLRTVLAFFQLYSFLSNCILAKKLLTVYDIKIIFDKTIFLCNIVIYLIFLDFLFKYLFSSSYYYDLVSYFLGQGLNTYLFDEKKYGLPILLGLTREPSHLAYFLFYCLSFFYIYIKIFNQKRLYIYSSCVLFFMFACLSFSSLNYLFCFVVFISIYSYLCDTKLFKKFLGSFIIFSVVCCFFLIFATEDSNCVFMQRLYNVRTSFFYIVSDDWRGRLSMTSEHVRFVSIVDSFKNFTDRPIFGLGAIAELCHSGLVSFIVNFGIIGLILWAGILLQLSLKKNSLVCIFILVIFPNCFVGFYSSFFSALPIFIVLLVTLIQNVKDMSYLNKGIS